MGVRIGFVPFVSRCEISPSQTQSGSWELLLLFALRGEGEGLEGKGICSHRCFESHRLSGHGPGLDQCMLNRTWSQFMRI